MRRPKHLHILKSPDGLSDHLQRFARGPLAVDTETSGLEWYRGDLVGSINCAAGRRAFVAYGDALGPVARWLGDQVKASRELVFHNAKFDLHQLRETFGLHVPYLVHDTNIQSFVVDNRGANAFGWRTKKKHSLKELAQVYVDDTAGDPEAALLSAIRRRGGAHKGDWPLLLDTPDERYFAEYSALDPWYTLQLHQRIHNWVQPEEEGWVYPSLASVYEREQWLIRAFLDMEARGIKCSRRFLERWRDELKVELDQQVRELTRLSKGATINWNSWQQLQHLLYQTLGIAGGPGTDAVSLTKLDHPIGPTMVKYREVFKQWSSYGNSLLEAITERGTIHPTFRSTGADTHRTSCVEPNLQQQTRVSGVRKAYRPRKGLVFRLADYSQVEMRFAGHIAQDPTLIDGFNQDPDFDTHGTTARRMFGKRFDPNSQHRKFGKIINFTKLFGGGEDKVTEQLINLISLKEAQAGCKALNARRQPGVNAWRALARAIIARFNEEYRPLTQQIRSEASKAEHRGYMMNLFGGHRFFDEGDDRWYAAFNTKVQGTAAIQAKEGLARVYRREQLKRGSLALLLLIHDEIVYESDGDPATDRRVLKHMQDLTSYRVPIIADMSGSTTSWQDKEKIKL
jgi:DNA polymerase-1